jgi:DNA-binding GntR family transcriptional regulator
MGLLNQANEMTRAEELYSRLKFDLMTGALLPGQKLSIRSLSGETGAGASPVREALKRLASERALEGGAKRSYVVPNLSDKRAVDLFNLRILLECEAAALALPRFAPTLLADLRTAVQFMDAALKSGDLDAYMRQNRTFHFVIYDQCENVDMIAMIEQLWTQTGPSLRHGMQADSCDLSWNRQHLAIVRALEARDTIALRREMLRDIGWGAEHYTRQSSPLPKQRPLLKMLEP